MWIHWIGKYMLKKDGSTEVEENNGGRHAQFSVEFWDTFYLQFTEGNTYKTVLRQWTVVTAVVKTGYRQEADFPISLAQPFDHATSYFRETQQW